MLPWLAGLPVVPKKRGNARGGTGERRASCSTGEPRLHQRQTYLCAPKLVELAARAKKVGRLTNVIQFVDGELLRLAFHSLRKQAAPGVDGQRSEDYARGLDENLWDLYRRLKRGRYRAPAIRRVYIPKANGKLRPLGITTTEDRVVQKAVAWVLSAVFEQDFLECSQGFRPKRSAHMALRRLRNGNAATLVQVRSGS
jgi:hypothetical protein